MLSTRKMKRLTLARNLKERKEVLEVMQSFLLVYIVTGFLGVTFIYALAKCYLDFLIK